MPFGYLRDPLFLVCFATYWVHRAAAARGWSTELLRGHLNDVICVPFFLPMMLWANRRLGLRRHDRPPEMIEIAVPLVIWSALFEIVLPLMHVPTIADPKDVASYCLGALIAVIVWRWRYRSREPAHSEIPRSFIN